MSVGLKMSLKLSQQLRMTPQLQQAIKLLQLSRMELETTVRKELIENPVLEEVHDSIESGPNKDNEPVRELTKDEAITSKNSTDDLSVQDPRKQDEFDWEAYNNDNYQRGAVGSGGSDEIMNYENIISEKQTLQDHLTWQLGLSGFNEEEYVIASIIVSYINDDGYLGTELSEIAESENIPVEEFDDILPFVQELDPPGVGARNLKECLLLQAKAIQEDTNDLIHIINNHLNDLQKKNYVAIAKQMDKEVDYIIDLCQIILGMDPKPGRAYMPSDTHFITPDVYVYKVGEEYIISLNEDGLPKLKISNLYKNLLNDQSSKDKNTQDYVQEKLKSAVWLIKSIQQRQRTIYKVTESIVKHQNDFFEKGPSHIKPMILRDIANDIGMHESTVSRVTTSKYMHTPRGIYELKYFFNSGLAKSDGNSVASESVKLKIKNLVENEDPKKPLSDQKLVDLLKKDGIKIARRTVAKYRDMLKILPSSKRKKYY